MSNKNIDVSRLGEFKKLDSKTTGEAKTPLIVIFPVRNVTVDEAMTLAMEKVKGCVALLDVSVYSKYWLIPLIYGEESIIVEGTPLIDPGNQLEIEN